MSDSTIAVDPAVMSEAGGRLGSIADATGEVQGVITGLAGVNGAAGDSRVAAAWDGFYDALCSDGAAVQSQMADLGADLQAGASTYVGTDEAAIPTSGLPAPESVFGLPPGSLTGNE